MEVTGFIYFDARVSAGLAHMNLSSERNHSPYDFHYSV